MSTYVYNSTISTNTYSTEDYGSISSSVDIGVDYSAGSLLPAQPIVDYTSYLYVPKPDFSSTIKTFDEDRNFSSTNIEFSSTTTLINQGEGFDSETYENFGNIYDNSTLTPFGSLELELTSGAISETEVYVASGTLFSVGVLDENVTFVWVGNGTVFEIGSGLERTVKPYIASGTLRMDASAAGTAIEKVTKSYNISSIYNPPLDYGSVTSYVLGGDDIGLITEQPSGSFPYDDFGLVSDPATQYPLRPFGPLRFVSNTVDNDYHTCDSEISCDSQTSAIVNFTANVPAQTILYTFSGTTLESFSAQTPEDIQLFSIFGELVHPFIDYTPHYGIDQNIGVGTTGIKFGSRVFPERFTFSYNENSPCYDSIAESLDFGLLTGTPIIPITSPNADFFDHGLVSEEETGNIPDDSGWITEPLITICPFGSTYLSGTALESFSSDTPDNTQLFSISGSLVEKNTEAYVGLGTHLFDVGIFNVPLTIDNKKVTFDSDYIYFDTTELRYDAIVSFTASPPTNTQLFSISGSSVESFTADTPDNTQLFSISGVVVEKFSPNIPGETALFVISGTSLETFSADTPDETILYTFSGSLVEKNTEVYVGLGSITLSNTALESFSVQTPDETILYTFSGSLVEKNTEAYVGLGSFGFVPGVGFAPDGDGNLRDAKTYSNRYGFQIGDFNLGSGIGTIRTRGIARTRLALPYFAQGSISLYDGLRESFSKANYDGFGISTISGIASSREINVYGYYGDDNNPGTSGTIFISQQTKPSIEKNTESYVGSGQLTISGDVSVLIRNSFLGLGIAQFSGTALESFSAQTPENIQLFTISGSSLEVYSAQTPETEVLYVINGFIDESITNNYEGSGSANLSGNSSTFYVPNYPARGTLRFIRHNTDNDYDTCDNEEITCDDQNSANVSFAVNPPENTISFNLDGTAVTTEIAVYTGTTSGLYTISGTSDNIKFVYSESGIGTIFTGNIASEIQTDVYIGSGNLFATSGASESYSAQTPENTQLFQISGSSATSVEFDYSVVGIGLFALSGSAITSEIATYTQIGSGAITLSGELVYPDVVYIPSPDGSGTINVLGSSNNSLTKTYNQIGGSLFAFSSGLESFTKSTYIGVGTIYIQEVSGSTINNPFQIPRTYVVII